MAILETEVIVSRFLVGDTVALIEATPTDQFAEQPLPGINHAAWILGHLTFSAHRGLELVGDANELPPDWAERFGPGSIPVGDAGLYPPRAELLARFRDAFARLHRASLQAPAARLAAPSANPHTAESLPTIKDAVAYLLSGHLGLHLGQLTTHRRLLGLPPVFG